MVFRPLAWYRRRCRAAGIPAGRQARSPASTRRFRPLVEWLEDRSLLSVSPLTLAVPLEFNALQAAHVAHFLSSPSEIDLYRVTLGIGDTFNADVNAQRAGSGLASLLRVFDAHGLPLALNDQEGGDPNLSFQAATAGDYFIGVSSAPNNLYDPTVAGSGNAGATTGLYTLDVHLAVGALRMPDLTGSSFRLGADMAVAGDAIPLDFTVENRGGADPGNFQVQVLLANNNLFDGAVQMLAILQRADLPADAMGRGFSSPLNFQVTVPAGQALGPERTEVAKKVGVPGTIWSGRVT